MGEITVAEAAAIAGCAPVTWRSYVSRGQAPKPVRRISREPLWDEDQVKAWASSRPGQGARNTDRARRRREADSAE